MIVQLHRLIVYTALVVAACVPAARTSTNGHGLPARPRIKDIFRLGGHTRPGGGGTGAGGGGQLLGCVQGAARGRRRPRCAWRGVVYQHQQQTGQSQHFTAGGADPVSTAAPHTGLSP